MNDTFLQRALKIIDDLTPDQIERELKEYGISYKRIGENMSNITPEYLHEILDRTYMIADMFESYVKEHPASEAVKEEVERVSEKLWDLYQVIGKVYFDSLPETELTTEDKQQVFMDNRVDNYKHSMRLEGLG